VNETRDEDVCVRNGAVGVLMRRLEGLMIRMSREETKSRVEFGRKYKRLREGKM